MRLPPPFYKILKQQKEEGKFKHSIYILKELSMNIPLLEVLEQMPRYVKFIKQLVTRKKEETIEDVDGVHHYSAVTTRSMA